MGSLDISAGTSALEIDPSGASASEYIIATYGANQITLTPPPSGSVLIVR